MSQPQTVKELRKCMGMTQKEFAEYFETTLRTVQRWEAPADASTFVQIPENLFHLMVYKYENELKIGNLVAH